MDTNTFFAMVREKALEQIERLLPNNADDTGDVDSAASNILRVSAVQSACTSFFPIWAHCLQQRTGRNMLLVLPNDEQARILAADFQSCGVQVHVLPSWSCVIGSEMSEHAPIRAERSEALYHLAHNAQSTSTQTNSAQTTSTQTTSTQKLVLCSTRSYLQLLPNPESLRQRSRVLRKGMKLDGTELAELLTEWNYTRVGQVHAHGEFAVRAEVLDICQSETGGECSGIRLNFDYGQLECLRRFNLNTQLGTEELESVLLHPPSEVHWDSNLQRGLPTLLQKTFPELEKKGIEALTESVRSKGYNAREYLAYPFLLKDAVHISTYFDAAPQVLYCYAEQLHSEMQRFWEEVEENFLHLGSKSPIPRPSRYKAALAPWVDPLPILQIFQNKTQDIPSLGDVKNKQYRTNMRFFLKNMEELCKNETVQVLINISSADQIDKMRILCTDSLLTLENFSLIPNSLHEGFHLEDGTLYAFTETDIFGKRMRNLSPELSTSIFHLDQLEEGDLVVHILYGIALFCGLQRRFFRGVEKDFIILEFAQKDRLFVPVEQINMIQSYIGQSSSEVALDSLESHSWQKKKARVQKNIEDMSADLLELQAKRTVAAGVSHAEVPWEPGFIDDFEHQETDDQIQAWDEIKADMQNPTPMDRLLVGDVGFGKTELALRAVFRAVSNGKQAVLLVPTTILAEQHYNTAQQRFRNYPVRVEMLSRFVSAAKRKTILADLAKGSVEFLVGTQKVLQKDIHFADLGLVIVDEEHRFGVKDKERIKRMRYNVDCLSMSATPIPRTLYQSLLQLRECSALTTAPRERKPIQTFVERFSEELLQSAIRKELERGGQVFVLHNRVSTLAQMTQLLETLVPEATILMANGQMPSPQLEENMYQFTHGAANVLVSTTIIENGIDIPDVNTIIIDRADMYGISQLYQLRGRVGRSKRSSYAYLLYRDDTHLSELALKRLTVISDHTELGSGFHIAMRDLEVRGAGNLLGKEQSGNIQAMGYEYYIQMLEKTMKKLKHEEEEDIEPVLELEFSGFIPNTYISEPALKMELYKQITTVKSMERYDEMMREIEDKYGPIAEEMRGLFFISKIRLLCKLLRITKLCARKNQLELHCDKLSLLPERKIKHLLEEGRLAMHPTLANVLLLSCPDGSLEDKYVLLKECLHEA